MQNNISTVLGIAAALCIALAVYVLWPEAPQSQEHYVPRFSSATSNAASTEAQTIPVPNSKRLTLTSGIERWYTNIDLKFSFQLPDGFNAPEIGGLEKGQYGVSVHDDAGSKLLVAVYPIATTATLSDSFIRENMPGVVVTNVTERVISTAVRGLMFRTNAKEWGGDGVGFWAIHNGRLYTVEGASKDQDLLEFITAHWYFAPPVPTAPKQN